MSHIPSFNICSYLMCVGNSYLMSMLSTYNREV